MSTKNVGSFLLMLLFGASFFFAMSRDARLDSATMSKIYGGQGPGGPLPAAQNSICSVDDIACRDIGKNCAWYVINQQPCPNNPLPTDPGQCWYQGTYNQVRNGLASKKFCQTASPEDECVVEICGSTEFCARRFKCRTSGMDCVESTQCVGYVCGKCR